MRGLGGTRPNSDEAGATPPVDALCATKLWGRSRLCHASGHDTFGRAPNALRKRQEKEMPYIKKPPEVVSRTLQIEQPVSELLDDYSRCVECSPDGSVPIPVEKEKAYSPEKSVKEKARNLLTGGSGHRRNTPWRRLALLEKWAKRVPYERGWR